MLTTDMTSIRYLCGFSGSDGALLISEHNAFLLVDGRYTTQARREAAFSEVIEYREKLEAIVAIVTSEGFEQLIFDPLLMLLDYYLTLKEKLPNTRLSPIKNVFGAIRTRKDPSEVSTIRRAAEIASCAFTRILKGLQVGVEERDLALELDYQIRSAGADGTSFNTIVASGPNAALPHARPSRRKLTLGDFIIFDYGAVHSGYCSDETCTVALGPVTNEQRLVYEIVKEAHDRGIDKIRPGVSCAEVDRTVRAHIESKGYGIFFGHATGHGVGMEVHEAPRLSQASEIILEAGMVVTVEPGIYLPEKWGVRIEDLVVVTESGCEPLSRVPKALTVVNS